MYKLSMLMAGSALGACLAVTAPGSAMAGPCTDQINEVAQALSNNPALGPATSGALAGSAPGAIKSDPPMPTPQAKSVDPAPSLSPGGKTSGSAGMSEMNAASNQIATSPQDVRLQQQGKPTAAQGGVETPADDRMSRAKMALEEARALDQTGNQACAASLDTARKLMQGG